MQPDSKTIDRNIGSEVWVLPAALQQLAESGDAVLVEELIEIFQTDTAERLALLRHAVETADHPVVRTEAHTIKGSALQVGALRVADACLQMELEARKPQPTDLPSLFRSLLQTFHEAQGAIAARIESPTDGTPCHGQ